MTREEFIKKIAPLVVKYAPQYNILCPSAVLSQAVLESDGGNSELAVKANNYFGLKYRAGRCPSGNGTYKKVGSEQDANTGKYTSSVMTWQRFPNMDAGIRGYFDFTNIDNYKSIKGVKDPKTYLENIKKAGYASSIKYVDNLMNVIEKYNLTQYDPKEEKLYYRVQTGSFSKKSNAEALQKKLKAAGFSAIIKEVDGLFKVQVGCYSSEVNAKAMYEKLKKKGYSCFIVYDGDKKKEDESKYPLVALSAGHGKDTPGKRCKKSIDPKETREWFLNDRIIDMVEKELKNYKCRILRVNDLTGKVDTPLKERTDAANKAKADFYFSMHHNAGINGGSGGGTTVYYYSSNPERKTQGKALYDAVVKETKLVGNRVDKVIKKSLHEVRETDMPALLLENGFMDSVKDTPIILTEEHAKKTAKGVVNFLVDLLDLKKR